MAVSWQRFWKDFSPPLNPRICCKQGERRARAGWSTVDTEAFFSNWHHLPPEHGESPAPRESYNSRQNAACGHSVSK
jgi:hypothetical protein